MTIDTSVINPYIRVAIPSVLRSGTVIARRVIFDYELIYIADGEVVLNYDEIDYGCEKGQFILLRPGVPHSFKEIHRDLSQPHIHFDITHTSNSALVPISFKDIDAFTDEERSRIREDIFKGYPQTPFVTFSNTEKALGLLYEIISVQGMSTLTRKAKLTELIDMLISDNFPDLFRENESHYGIEDQLKDYIDAGQGMASCLDDIAKQFSYSKYYLERRFKDRYGVGLITYRNGKRMEMAEKMLKTETVSSVSEKLGFSSIYVFSRAFKNHFGVSPIEIAKAR